MYDGSDVSGYIWRYLLRNSARDVYGPFEERI